MNYYMNITRYIIDSGYCLHSAHNPLRHSPAASWMERPVAQWLHQLPHALWEGGPMLGCPYGWTGDMRNLTSTSCPDNSISCPDNTISYLVTEDSRSGGLWRQGISTWCVAECDLHQRHRWKVIFYWYSVLVSFPLSLFLQTDIMIIIQAIYVPL